jgi:hypothetical protein
METKKIYKALARVMAAIDPVSKARKNMAQGYQFRGVDDVYQAVQQIMAKEGVICVPRVIADRTEERTTPKGTVLIYRILTIEFDFFADDGSSVTCRMIGEGMDSGDKASNKAMSVAHKYAFLQVFCIPTEEPKDPENDSHEVTESKPGASKFSAVQAEVARQNAKAAASSNDKVELTKWGLGHAEKQKVHISKGSLEAFYDGNCKGLSKRDAAVKIRDYISDLASVTG